MTISQQLPAAVIVTALAEVCQLYTKDLERLTAQVKVAGAPLTGFEIWGRTNSAGDFMQLYSTSADYLSPSGLLVGASGDLTTQVVGSGFFIMDVAGFERIQIKAAGSSSSVQIIPGGEYGQVE